MPRNRLQLLDQDYEHKLNIVEKAWLKRFNEEWANASFKHRRARTNKRYRKACYDANNARNRDLYNLLKCTGKLDFKRNPKVFTRLNEDAVIASLDRAHISAWPKKNFKKPSKS